MIVTYAQIVEVLLIKSYQLIETEIKIIQRYAKTE